MPFKTIRGVKVFINPRTDKIAPNANGHETLTRAKLEKATVDLAKLQKRLVGNPEGLDHDRLRKLAVKTSVATQKKQRLEEQNQKERSIMAKFPEDFN